MPPHETAHRHDKAVLWRRTGQSSDGRPTYAEPVELTVRWEDRRREGFDTFGNSISFLARVVLDVDVAVDDVMWLGELADWDSEGDLMRVAEFRKTQDVKGRNVRRTADLARFGGSFGS